jgi:hypothetical protein
MRLKFYAEFFYWNLNMSGQKPKFDILIETKKLFNPKK